MTGLTAGLITLLALQTFGIIGHRILRSRLPDSVENLRGQIRDLTKESNDLIKRLRWSEEDRNKADESMRFFRKIAETHDLSKIPDPPQAIKVWTSRMYRDKPDKNLLNLEEDLREFTGCEIKLAIEITGEGKWRAHMKKWYSSHTRPNDPTDYCATFHRSGTPDRVISELKTLFFDPHASFVTPEGEWLYKESPLWFDVNMSMTSIKKFVHVVEVVRVEEKIVEVEKVVERIIEREIRDPEWEEAQREIQLLEQKVKKASSIL